MTLKTSYAAIILDMDGVVTQTAILHAEAWRSKFSEFQRTSTT